MKIKQAIEYYQESKYRLSTAMTTDYFNLKDELEKEYMSYLKLKKESQKPIRMSDNIDENTRIRLITQKCELKALIQLKEHRVEELKSEMIDMEETMDFLGFKDFPKRVQGTLNRIKYEFMTINESEI